MITERKTAKLIVAEADDHDEGHDGDPGAGVLSIVLRKSNKATLAP